MGGDANFCRSSFPEDGMETFMLRQESNWNSNPIRRSLGDSINYCVERWSDLSEGEKASGLRILREHWSSPGDAGKIAGALCQVFQNRRDELSGLLGACFHDAQNPPRAKTIRTIGTYYPYYYYDQCKGGIHRVMSMLMPLWVRMGYRVVLFTDMAEGQDMDSADTRCPAGVIWVNCTVPTHQSADDYERRGVEMERLLREYEIDVMVYQDYLNPCLLWESLLCRLLDIPFLTYYHTICTRWIAHWDPRFYQIPYAARIGNAVAVLSEIDQKFWRCAVPNIRVSQVNNPLTFDPDTVQPSTLTNPRIVWVGRLDEVVKQFFDPVDIMREVIREVPEAKLYLVGEDNSGKNLQRLREKVSEMRLEKSVVLCGFQQDVAPYYQSASVFLMTSACEGYPMVLTEALAFGLPVVMYALPYLTLVRGNKGVISVPQRDTRAAAEEICKLLKDRTCREERGRQGRKFLQSLYSGDKIVEQWRNIFDSIDRPATEAPESETDQLLFQTLLEHYRLSQPESKSPAIGKPEEAFLLAIDHVDQRLEDGRISVEIHLRPEYNGKFDFAWYLEHNGKIVKKVYYQAENKYEFSNLEAGKYRVKCYLRCGKLIKSFYTASVIY